MLRPFKVQNVKPGYLLEARIKRGKELLQQSAIPYGQQAAGGVPGDATLQVRETKLSTGEKTPWQTALRALPTAKRTKRGRQIPRKENPKAGELVKRHLRRIARAMKTGREKGPAAMAKYYEKIAAKAEAEGQPIRAAEYRLEAKAHKKNKPAGKRRATSVEKKNPGKSRRPPKEFFYYFVQPPKDATRRIADPEAYAAKLWHSLKAHTKRRLMKIINQARAAGQKIVVDFYGIVTPANVKKRLGKAKATELYRKIKITAAEKKAAREALEKPKKKTRGNPEQKAIRRLRTCSICGKKVMDVLQHRWKKHREIMLENVTKARKKRAREERKKSATGRRRKKNRCMKTEAI